MIAHRVPTKGRHVGSFLRKLRREVIRQGPVRACLDMNVIRYCCLVVAVGLSFLVAGCTNGDPSDREDPTTGDIALTGGIEWSMPARFGLDLNGNGLIDIPNSIDYVLNLDPGSCASGCDGVVPVFSVLLDATSLRLHDESGTVLPIEAYTWTVIDSSIGSPTVTVGGLQATVELPEGQFEVALEITSGLHSRVLEETIAVQDVVIAAIGDSYAAGEGNPEVPGKPARWADGGGSPDLGEDLDHDAAHRGGLAGPAQAALALERADPHTSVTFVFLAASGAGIDEGILAELESASIREGTRRVLPPQVDQLADIMGCTPGSSGECLRTVDHLIVSAGGNDIGFAFTVGSLIALDPLLLLDSVYQNLLDNLMIEVAEDIAALPARFNQLAEALDDIEVAETLLAGYPGALSVEIDGEIVTCDEIGGDLLPALEVDLRELEAVREVLLVPLNDTLRSIADGHDWIFVDGHIADFERHGYCGADPYVGREYTGNPFPEDVAMVQDPGVRWFRTAEESSAIQGGGGLFQPERLATSGTFHPNELGHQAYRDAFLEVLRND